MKLLRANLSSALSKQVKTFVEKNPGSLTENRRAAAAAAKSKQGFLDSQEEAAKGQNNTNEDKQAAK